MRTTALLLATSVLLAPALLTPDLGAQNQQPGSKDRDSKRSTERSARSFRRLKVPGTEVAENVRKLTKELHWHKTLASALAAGRTKGKPVLWIQALGDIDGFL